MCVELITELLRNNNTIISATKESLTHKFVLYTQLIKPVTQ